MKNLILFLSFCLYSCCVTPPHGKAADEFIKYFSTQVYRSHDLQLAGSGGAFLDDIQEFYFTFYSNEHIDNIDDARKLIVAVIEELLDSVNSDPKLQPYLHKTPFDINDVEIDILFFDPKGGYLIPPYIAMICNIKGDVHYTYYDITKKELENLYEEPYTASKRIVEQQARISTK